MTDIVVSILFEEDLFLHRHVWVAFVGLLLYWNFAAAVYHVALVLTWWIFTTDVYMWCVSVVPYMMVPMALWVSSTELLADGDCLLARADVVGLALYTKESMGNWTGAIASRIIITVGVNCIASLVKMRERWSRMHHAVFCIWALALTACCALQWSYYITLPSMDADTASSSSRVLCSTSVIYVIGLGVRSCLLAVTCMYRLLFEQICAVVRWIAPTGRPLQDTLWDPFSEGFMISMSLCYAVIIGLASFILSPSTMPLPLQLLVLLRLYIVVLASAHLQEYQRLLTAFPLVEVTPSQTCAICLEEFRQGETAPQVPCGHTFHGPCLHRWLSRSPQCPVCRATTRERPVASASDDSRPVGAPAVTPAYIVHTARPPGHQRLSTSVPELFSGSTQPLPPRPPANGNHSPHVTAAAAALSYMRGLGTPSEDRYWTDQPEWMMQTGDATSGSGSISSTDHASSGTAQSSDADFLEDEPLATWSTVGVEGEATESPILRKRSRSPDASQDLPSAAGKQRRVEDI